MKKIICHKITEYLKLLYDCAILNVFIYVFVTILYNMNKQEHWSRNDLKP